MVVAQPITHKVCACCGIGKPVYDFHKNLRHSTGYRSECKVCTRELARDSYKKTKQKAAKAAIKECLNCGETVKDDRHDYCSNSCARLYEARDPSKHSHWTGDNLSKSAAHSWMHDHHKKPKVCDHCGKPPMTGKDGRTLLHWANISGKYRRSRSDWLALCVKCHSAFDKSWLKRVRSAGGQFV